MSNVHGKGKPARKKEPKAKEGTPDAKVAFPWRAFAALAISGLVVVAAYWFLSRAPEGTGPPPAGGLPVAVIETNYGTIRVELDTVNAPVTAGNFISLAKAGRYNGNAFHRVAADFVIQGGAVSGAGNVPWEDTGLRNVAYSIAMARSGSANDTGSKDTATSQFFINLKGNPNLDAYDPGTRLGVTYPYVVFGIVIAGQGVVDTIGAIPSNPPGDGQPTSPVTITSVTISE